MTWDTNLMSGAPTYSTNAFDDSQWTSVTGQGNPNTVGSTRSGVPSVAETVMPAGSVAAATYGGAGSMLPFAALAAGVVLLVLVLHHHH
jgi:hypothetical protein